MPMKIPTVIPKVDKPAPVARASSGQPPDSARAPMKGHAKKQATGSKDTNVKTSRSAKAPIDISLAPARRQGLKAGTAVKEADVLDQEIDQAEETVVQPAVTRSAPEKRVPTSPEMVEPAGETPAIRTSRKEKHPTRANSSVKAPITAPSFSVCDTKPSTNKTGIEVVQFKSSHLALERVQSFSGGKPTGWIPANKGQDSKKSGTSNTGDLTTQIRILSPHGNVIESSDAGGIRVTQNKTPTSQDKGFLFRVNSTKENIVSDGLTTVEQLVEVPVSQTASEMGVDKASSRRYRYSPFTLQNPYPYSLPSMALSSEPDDKTSSYEPVDLRSPATSSTDRRPIVEDMDPEVDSLELTGENDDSEEGPWVRTFELAEVEEFPFEGFQQPKPQPVYIKDDHLFSVTLFSTYDEGLGSTVRKPYERAARGYRDLYKALRIVENMAESSILRCHIRIMRNEIEVLHKGLPLYMHAFRGFRRYRVEMDRLSKLNPESQELLLYLVNQKRVNTRFDDYTMMYAELTTRWYDLERYYIYRSGSPWRAIGTMRASIARSKDIIRRGNTSSNVREMATDLWQFHDKGYGTQDRKQFDEASHLRGEIIKGQGLVQILSSAVMDHWNDFFKPVQAHRTFRKKAVALHKQSSSMHLYLYAYESIALRQLMDIAANAARSDVVNGHADVLGSAQAGIHKDLSSKNQHGMQHAPIQKAPPGAFFKYKSLKDYKRVGKKTSYCRVFSKSTHKRKYHTIRTSFCSSEEPPSTSDPDGSSTAVGGNDTAGVASSTIDGADESDGALSVDHPYLRYQIPDSRLREAMLASRSTGAAYWQYSLYEDATGEKPRVHYCKTMEATERISQLFLGKEVVGFDIEWKPGATPSNGIKNNVSLVQLASEERIALFHIARYGKDGIENLVSHTLRQIMEDPNITKVGVSVKADCTRLRKFTGIQSRGLFELSHLYKLVRYSDGNVKKIDKRLVALAQQVEEHLQLPMWKGEVRSSDWTEDLSYQQIQYAASDSYAGLQLYDVMEGKRKALVPTPPRPEHAELNLPIRLANGQTVATYDESEEVTNENPTNDNGSQPIDIEEMARDFLNIAIEDSEGTQPPVKLSKSRKSKSCSDKPPDIIAAEEWIQQWRATLPSDYKTKATPAYLRAYFLWHHSDKEVLEAASILRDPPLQASTVSNYILEAVRIEKLPFDSYRLPEVLAHLPPGLAKGKYQSLRKLAN